MSSINHDNIRSIIIIQNKFRVVKQQLYVLNNELIMIKSIISNMLDNINKLFNNKIISSKKYNNGLELISEIHNTFKGFPKTPIKLSDMMDTSLLELQIKKTKLYKKILETVKKVGLPSLDDIMKLFINNRWSEKVSYDYYNLM